MWKSEYEKGFDLTLFQEFDDFKYSWLEMFPEEYRENRTYRFYTDHLIPSVISHPYQSKGNYIKRVFLKRLPAGQSSISFIYYIDSSQGNEEGRPLKVLYIELYQENEQWFVTSFRITAG